MLNRVVNAKRHFNTCTPMRNTLRALGFNGSVKHANFVGTKQFNFICKIPLFGKRRLLRI